MEPFPPGLRNSLLQNDVDSGVVMLHRDTISNRGEFKCLVSMKGVFSLLKVKVIEDRSSIERLRIAWRYVRKHPQSLSPLCFQLAEFIVGHWGYLLLERGGVDGVSPAASGCRESSPAKACLAPAGSHPSRLRAPLAF